MRQSYDDEEKPATSTQEQDTPAMTARARERWTMSESLAVFGNIEHWNRPKYTEAVQVARARLARAEVAKAEVAKGKPVQGAGGSRDVSNNSSPSNDGKITDTSPCVEQDEDVEELQRQSVS